MLKKIQGCLFGGAIGDALGMPYAGLTRESISKFTDLEQFRSSQSIRSLFLPLGAIADSDEGDLLEAGQWTDDTQLTLALAESLLEEGGIFIPEAWGHKLVRWLNDEPRGPGLSSLHAAIQLRSGGVFWDESADPYGQGCGAATRVAPIAILFEKAPELRRSNAITQAMVTHGLPEAVAASLAVCEAIAKVLPMTQKEIDSWDGAFFLTELASQVQSVSSVFSNCLQTAANLLQDNAPPADAVRAIGVSALAQEATTTALYLIAQNPTRFDQSLIDSVRLTGDAVESIATMVGAISGAMHGIDGIPGTWKENVEDHARLLSISQRLCDARVRSSK